MIEVNLMVDIRFTEYNIRYGDTCYCEKVSLENSNDEGEVVCLHAFEYIL